ncbi:hypothetical protein OAA64_01365 [bacterium]|nr:hypothetical protein [bacterium]
MGRFISGGSVTDFGFTKAAVYDTPGTASWTVPAGVSKAKVFVIGAGSCYRSTEFCFVSASCCSGVATPGTDYCMNFVGHLTGAGGGYAEKTIDGLSPGASMTVNVGSVGGLTASSIVMGSTTVTANNATEQTISWNCTSNSTTRDNSNDNKVSLGFDLPVCGYINCINGYFNTGGTAVGGDINRNGGEGVFIPFFREDGNIDGSLCIQEGAGGGGAAAGPTGCTCNNNYFNGYDYSFGGTRRSCVCTISYLAAQQSLNSGTCGCCFYWGGDTDHQCLCYVGYHYVFGQTFYDRLNWQCCTCQRMCNGAYLCACGGGGGGGGSAEGTNILASTSSGPSFPYNDDDFQVNACPVGIGAEAGSSSANGFDGVSDVTVMNLGGASSGGAGGAVDIGATYVCYTGFSQDHWTFYFGSNNSNWPCSTWSNLIGSSSSGGSGISLGYSKDVDSLRTSNANIIPLSTLTDAAGANQGDYKFGYGANSKEGAGKGGGGNRLFPSGGSGSVVIVY